MTARVLVASAALALVFHNQDWNELREVFSGLGIGHFIFTLIVFVLCQVGVALRWFLLLRAQLVRLNIWTVVRLHFLGLFYNNLMPSSIGGDVLRAWYVSKHTDKRFAAALSVVVDRGIGLCSILIMAIFGYVFLVQDAAFQSERNVDNSTMLPDASSHRGLTLYFIAMLMVMLLILLLHGPSRMFLVDLWRRVLSQLFQLTRKAKDAMVLYGRNPVVLFVALGLSLFLQSCTILAFWILGSSIGIEAGLKLYFLIFPTVWVLGALPISVAGIGILEGGIKVLFVQLARTSGEQATCLALCQRFVLILASLPGAIIHLFGGHLPRAFSSDIQKPGD